MGLYSCAELPSPAAGPVRIGEIAMSIGRPACLLAIATGMLVLLAPAQGRAQAIALDELDRWNVDAKLTREQVNRFNGREVVATIDQSWLVEIGPPPYLKSTSKNQIRGRPEAKPMTGSFRIGTTREVKSFGGGDGEWTLDGDTLTFTRSFKRGALRLRIAVKRKDDGFECEATQSFAREGGTGDVVFWSPLVQSDVTIVTWRMLSSTCQMSKR